jgi:hypothetical protein
VTEGTKEHPAPLDGFERAKPNEPIFTLQGGDPIAIAATHWYIEQRRQAAFQLPEDDPKRREELQRCSLAEEQLWVMEAYLRGDRREEAEIPDENLNVPEAKTLHDFRVWSAGRISSAFSELNEIKEKLPELGFNNEAALRVLDESFSLLRSVYNEIEPRRDRYLKRP